MNVFSYERAADPAAAVKLFAAGRNPKYLGGGTNLVDLMREQIEQPGTIIDVSGISQGIELRADGTILLGAGAKNTAVASHWDIRDRYPMLAQAIVNGASAQIRNMATVGGNLMQRTRCYYFYDSAAHCNKRVRGSGCDALEGFNRIHAILGTSAHCIAAHPSDMCVALAALDAIVHIEGSNGARKVKLTDLHRLPGDAPDVETELAAGELITQVEIPPLPFASRSVYQKVRDRASYAFALVSVAAAVDFDEPGQTIRAARVALGGVAHKPWRAHLAEKVLQGAPATEESFRQAAEAEMALAVGHAHNDFKIDLTRRVIIATLKELTQQSGDKS
ncbi:MAG: FAD binding domain-containing protein [Steroidobacteraceae bacterium]